ncbi:MAG: lipopolysaccharide kinase InaA family protein [Planctomycetota bacterium]|jgi:hypothetical protein
MTSGGEIQAPVYWIYVAPGFRERLRRAGLDNLEGLSDRALGEVVTDHPTTWVRRARIDTVDVYIKTYDYPTWRDRGRGLGRNTALAPSRPAREHAALKWLQSHGFGGPEGLAVVEARRLGFVWRATLATAAWPGRPLDRLLPTLAAQDRSALLGDLQRFVDRLHRAGFRDGNLDLRNLLARKSLGGWEIAKIDSPRFRVVAAGEPGDRWARQDQKRLRDSLEAAGVAADC